LPQQEGDGRDAERDQREVQHAGRVAGVAAAKQAGAVHRARSGWDNPVGRTISTRMSRTTATAGDSANDTHSVDRLSARPRTSPATSVPTGLPSPPRTTTAKDRPAYATPSDGLSGLIMAINDPAAPA